MKRILVVEDDSSYLELIKNVLKEHGYEVDGVTDPLVALEQVSKNTYDLVVSDYDMKIMDGIRLVKTIKNMQPMIRSIILTGYPDEESEIAALEGVVDQYIVKEKPMSVILKYIEKVLTTQLVVASSETLVSESENIILDKKRHEVKKNGIVLSLTPKEFGILHLFLDQKGEILSRDDIIREVWGINPNEVEERMVDIHIKNLRDKLKTFSIVSIRGFGYKWNE